MTSQLASQLQRLQQRPSSNKHLSVSFLFDKNDARSFTREQIHQLATAGLQTLVVIDNRFHAFIEPLFSPQKTRLERERLSSHENKELDRLLEHLLTLLSPHLFLTAAQQVFEYLVRVYEVHVYNVMGVLRAFLPYHDHNLFARALLMLDLRDTGFQFLVTNQERGAPLLREHLILAAAESRKALRLVCLTMAFAVRYKVQNNAANALFAAVAVGLATHAEAESIWRVLVPFVLEFLSGDVSGAELGSADAMLHLDEDEDRETGGDGEAAAAGPARRRRGGEPENRDVVCTALVVLASWSGEVQFTAPMMSALMKPLLRFLESGTSSHPVVPLVDLLQLLDLLFTTQLAVVQDLPFGPHLASLVELPWAQWMPMLHETLRMADPTRRADVPLRTLVTVLLQYGLGRLAVAQSLDVVPRAVLDFLTLAAEELPLSHTSVKFYLGQLMAYEAKRTPEDGATAGAAAVAASAFSSKFLDRVTLALEGRYQRAFDETLSDLLQTQTQADTSSSSPTATTTMTTAESKKKASEAAVLFLSRHLGGARYHMLSVKTRSSATTTEKLPLFACLLHPLPAVRQVAIEALRTVPLSAVCSSARRTGASDDNNEGEAVNEEAGAEDQDGEAPLHGTRAVHYQRDAKGSLLELLAHVAEFEADQQTALQLMTVCASVLAQLQHHLLSATSDAPTKSKSKSKSKAAAKAPRVADAQKMPDAAFCVNACRLLLRALHQLAILHVGAVREVYLDQALRIFLDSSSESDSEDAAAPVRSCAVYLTVQLYLLSAHDLVSETAKALTEKTAALLQSVYPTLKPCATASPSALFSVVTPSTTMPTEARTGGGGRGGKARAAPDSSDDDDEDAQKNAQGDAAATKAASSSGPALALWECAALLADAWSEAECQLPRLTARLEQLARADDASAAEAAEAVELEVCLAVAAQLIAEPSTGAALLSQLLVGQSARVAGDEEAESASLARHGYLGLRVAAQRGAARQALTGESRVAVGRGVQNSVLASEYVPHDRLTARLAAVCQSVVKLWLSKSAVSATTVLSVLGVLGVLGAALPPLASCPKLLAPALFDLLSQQSHPTTTALYPVDWFHLVYDALTRPAATTAAAPAATSKAAIALALLLPLWAPLNHRVALLQELQATLLPGATRTSSTAVVLHAAMQDKSLGLSLTTISAVIESMAREASRFELTRAAADLVAQLVAEPVEAVLTPEERDETSATLRYVVPHAMAADVLTYFFAPVLDASHNGNSNQTKKSAASAAGGARLNLAVILPRLLSQLPLASLARETDAPGKSHKSKSRARVAKEAAAEVPEEAARLLEVACRRVELAPSGVDVAQDPAVTLCVALLRSPFLATRSGTSGVHRTRPVYRLALSLLATAMQRGRLAETSSQATRNPLIFTASKSNAKASKDAASGETEAYLEAVAAVLRPIVLGAVSVIGNDVATLCVGTVGGFHRFFLPFLASLTAGTQEKGARQATTQVADGVDRLEVLLELMQALAPQARAHTAQQTADDEEAGAAAASRSDDDVWLPASNCALSTPFTFAYAMNVLDVISATLAEPRQTSATPHWHKTETHLRCLDLLSALLQATPAIAFDDEDEEASLFTLVQTLLERFPVSDMCSLLAPEAEDGDDVGAASVTGALTTIEGSHRLVTPYVQRVVQLLHDLTHLCEHQSSALSEHDAQGTFRVRSTLVKQSLLLMATLLTTTTTSGTDAHGESDGDGDISRARLDAITELLRALAPLFSLRGLPTRAGGSAAGDDTTAASGQLNAYLHIPLAALLIRLEPVEKTEALRYRSAVEVCQEVLGSFDIHTQITCISQLMHLVMDPAAQLAAEPTNEEDETSDAHKDVEETLHLFRRLVKPNQIINRQEPLLALVNLSVKSDSFLGPFIELQHRSQRTGAASKTGAEADGQEDDQDTHTRKAEEGTHTSAECMDLLVSALELFAHYSDLNAQTANEAASNTTMAATTTMNAEYSEEKAYVMLLELLAGNALACVLAGINEPTFVSCLSRLLVDQRTALQQKGLEVLLDRLHHSLPTVENTLTDEELEQHRRELRDPRKRLTLMDLIRIKARPLTTKRSFSLYPLVETILRAAIRSLYAVTRGATTVVAATSGESLVHLALPLNALEAVFNLAQLATACMEELIRIIGSGGSTQAEKTLLNASRSKRVTEATLSKLFGNKARIQAVHATLEALCAEWVPQLTLCTQKLYQVPSRTTATATTTVAAGKAQASAPARRAANAPSFSAAPPSRSGNADEEDAVAPSTGTFASSASAYSQLAEEGFLATVAMLMTMLASTLQVMGVAFSAPHSMDVLQTIVAAAVFQVVELPAVVTHRAGGSLLRRTTLSAFVRCYPACWQFSQPFLPRVLFAATHLTNVDDAETNYLCTELLTMLEALLEPQLFLEACAACVRGTPYVNTAVIVGSKAQQAALATMATTTTGPTGGRRPASQLRLLVATHSFHTFFQCVQRRVQNLRKEELAHMSMLTDGTTPEDNFWLSALEALAVTMTMPPAEVVKPVLDAFTTFFLKFKPKHCIKFLRLVAEWAFAATSTSGKQQQKKRKQAEAAGGDSDSDSDAAKQLSRTTLHRWLTFYALVNHLLEKLGSILDFGFPVLITYVTSTLHTYCSAGTHPAKQYASLLALTLEGALETVRRMSKAQTPGPDYDYSIPLDIFFATPEVFNGLMPALIHQLTNLALLQDDAHSYAFRAEHAVIPAVRAFFACLHSGKLQSKAQAELARGLRHPSRLVRYQTVMCLDGVYADGGEELASRLMAEVLPAVVELTEDRDDDVVEAARTMCTNLSNITGQDVLHAMS